MTPQDEMWTFDYYTAQLSVAAQSLDKLLADGAANPSDIEKLVDHFPIARRPAAISFLNTLSSRTALQIYSMRINAEREARVFMSEQAQATQGRKDARGRELRAFWVGLVLLVIPIVVSISVPSPNIPATQSLRVCSGAGLALLIAFIPGFFALDSTVDTKVVKFSFRTAGAMAGLAMIYFFDPGTISEVLRSFAKNH